MVDSRLKGAKALRQRKNRNRNTNRYLEPVKGNNSTPQRAKYFKAFRPERTLLRTLECSRDTLLNRKSYRANRYLYYVLLPKLYLCLSYQPDRVRLNYVEDYLYGAILSYQFKRGREGNVADRLVLPMFRYTSGTTVPDSQQKL